jgi:hypothetical protein
MTWSFSCKKIPLWYHSRTALRLLFVERKYTALSHARFATKARRSRAVLLARLDHSFLKANVCGYIITYTN